jgi:hypothetical protein
LTAEKTKNEAREDNVSFFSSPSPVPPVPPPLPAPDYPGSYMDTNNVMYNWAEVTEQFQEATKGEIENHRNFNPILFTNTDTTIA